MTPDSNTLEDTSLKTQPDPQKLPNFSDTPKFHDDFNNSLVFGNDNNDTQFDHEGPIIHQETTTQADTNSSQKSATNNAFSLKFGEPIDFEDLTERDATDLNPDVIISSPVKRYIGVGTGSAANVPELSNSGDITNADTIPMDITNITNAPTQVDMPEKMETTDNNTHEFDRQAPPARYLVPGTTKPSHDTQQSAQSLFQETQKIRRDTTGSEDRENYDLGRNLPIFDDTQIGVQLTPTQKDNTLDSQNGARTINDIGSRHVFFDTQPDNFNGPQGQNIPTQAIQPNDPQLERTLPNSSNTQVINADTQRVHVLADTQSDNGFAETEPVNLAETQVINFMGSQTQKIPHGPRDVSTPQGSQTQVIGARIDVLKTPINKDDASDKIQPTIEEVGEDDERNEERIGESSPIALELSTQNGTKKSHTQVLNTQEQSEIGLSIEQNEKEEIHDPFSFKDGEEVRTDDEQEDPTEIPDVDIDADLDEEEDLSILDHQYDDSLFAHKITKRRKLLPPSQTTLSPGKGKRQYKSFNMANSSKLSDLQLHPKSDPIVLESPGEIVESSPAVKVTNYLHFPTRSSPTKADTSLNSIGESSPNDIEDTLMDLTLDKDVNEDNEDNNDYEVSDIDVDIDTDESIYQPEEAFPKRTARRKRKYVIDSQSQSVPGTAEDPDDPDDPDAPEDPAELENKKSDTQKIIPETTVSHEEIPILSTFREEKSLVLTNDEIKYPDSVWAAFNLKVYSGRIVSKGSESSVVEFPMGNDSIKNSDIFPLDIRIGDTVRIRTSTSTFTVTGLACKNEEERIRCIRGYDLVYIQKLKHKEIAVPLSEIYLDWSEWILHLETYGLVDESKDVQKSNIESASNIPQSTRNQRTQRRNNTRVQARTQEIESNTKSLGSKINLSVSNHQAIGNGLDSVYRDDLYTASFRSPSITVPRGENEDVLKASSNPSSQLFEGRLFCITSIDGERKDEIKTLIEDNGGTIIEEGLDALFDFNSESSSGLLLESNQLAQFGFGCMISNNFCRSAKYLQALALGWPILSDSFIRDSVKDSNKLEEWPIYLLPAGQSKLLNSIKSLDIFNFRIKYERNERLSEQLANNGHLLKKNNVIVFNYKINSTALKTSKFIFYAFGAKSLKYCTTYAQVLEWVKKLKDQGETEILIYDDCGSINTKLVGPKKTKSRKRKDSEAIPTQADDIEFKVIDWEWVVQCVISGYIWEPPTFRITT